ncbi:MAG: DUF2817 domain-containing protein [Actinobacteria bacterium]|nr:DUF2817 domain-containing protein [Actinomycetota bacterium]
MPQPSDETFIEARADFLAAADAAGGLVRSWQHPLRGRCDEDLFLDVAEVGPVDATSLVVVVSGTHGAEYIEGSRLQRQHLRVAGLASGLEAAGVCLAFVHAFEPFGASWTREADADNVDLNRNFIDRIGPPPAHPAYDAYADSIVPQRWDVASEAHAVATLYGALAELGPLEFQSLITRGQYDHPRGLFYGGVGPSWSHRWLVDWIAARWSGLRRAAVIDVRTGLGERGAIERCSSGGDGTDDATTRARSWWPDLRVRGDDRSVLAGVVGEWLPALAGLAPAVEVTAVSMECGVSDPARALLALRAETWWHMVGDRRSAEADQARSLLRAAYAADDPAWTAAVWPVYLDTVDAAVRGLSEGTVDAA